MKNNRRLLNYLLLAAYVLLAFTYSCKKDDDSNQVKDTDGNVYTTVAIGSQVWMVEDLKTTHFNDGTPIPNATDSMAWSNITTPAYCWNNNDSRNKSVYGALYNFNTVKTGNLAPKGWHVATDAEWTALTTFLGGDQVAGGKMKENGTIHWKTPNTDGTNTSGFTALPAGFRTGFNIFGDVGYLGGWWTSSEAASGFPLGRQLNYSDGTINAGYAPPNMGFSVRCIKD